MRFKLFLVAAMVMGVWTGAYAQAGGSAAAAAAGPEKTSGFGKDANYDSLQAHQRGGIAFTGKVAVSNGMMPWDPIPVVVTCNGKVRYRTEADAKGNFTIAGESSNDMGSEVVPTNASVHEVTASQMIGCDVRASVPGFKSTSQHIANLNIMDNMDLGTITLTPDEMATTSTVSASYATASKDAIKRYDKARAEWMNKNINGAEKDLQKAVQIDPKFADAWYELGKMQQQNNKMQQALASYQTATTADPKFISPYERIAELAAQKKQWQVVTNATETALTLDPEGTPQLWYFDAVGNYNLGKVDVAEASARKSLAMDPQHLAPNTEQLLAVMLAGQGQYAEALQHLKNSLTYMKPGPNTELIKQQIAQLEKVVPQGSK